VDRDRHQYYNAGAQESAWNKCSAFADHLSLKIASAAANGKYSKADKQNFHLFKVEISSKRFFRRFHEFMVAQSAIFSWTWLGFPSNLRGFLF